MSSEQFGKVLISVLGLALFGLLAWQLLPRDRSLPEPTPGLAVPPTPTVVAQATTPPPEPTAPPLATPPPLATTPPPTTPPAPTTPPPPTEAPLGQTVLFRGGPATGPWQQIGTVAEITHPDAPPTARQAYTEHWSDPDEENMPASLWDICVAQVAEQAVLLGPPLERPPFDGDRPEAVAFNAFGGTQRADFDERLLVAGWGVFYERPDGVAGWANFPYLLSFEGTILERGEPLLIVETDFATHEEAAAFGQQWFLEWSQPLIEARAAENG